MSNDVRKNAGFSLTLYIVNTGSRKVTLTVLNVGCGSSINNMEQSIDAGITNKQAFYSV